MSRPGPPPEIVRVTRCDSEALTAAASLVQRYREHYGEAPEQEERAASWLSAMVDAGMLVVFTATTGSVGGPQGLLTAHVTPASLRLAVFWQVRDLFVLPQARGRGVATALLAAVREAALEAGATRLSLQTETENHTALSLYRRLGFRPITGLTTLSTDLADG